MEKFIFRKENYMPAANLCVEMKTVLLYSNPMFPCLVGVGCTLTWSKRMKIALDAAKGLAILHDAERPIIYRDFKTSNILLDKVSYYFFVCTLLHTNAVHPSFFFFYFKGLSIN